MKSERWVPMIWLLKLIIEGQALASGQLRALTRKLRLILHSRHVSHIQELEVSNQIVEVRNKLKLGLAEYIRGKDPIRLSVRRFTYELLAK
ncbi:AKR_collapsed_G0047230.mRNA.1.CDS.1 [Saccharomyces cerevisiae]|nr:AKR_collapsed_G0047230.mRNA.1.CDS.1 [Saccharomyces cerevisiae]